MTCGVYMTYLDARRGKVPTVDRLFRGFDVFAASLVPALLRFGVAFVAGQVTGPLVALVFMAIRDGMGGSGGGTEAVLLIGQMVASTGAGQVVGTVATVFLLFCELLIVDRGMKGWESVGAGFALTKANFVPILGVAAVLAGLHLVATLVCCIGPFLAAPIIYGVTVVAYRRLFPDPTEPPPPDEPEPRAA